MEEPQFKDVFSYEGHITPLAVVEEVEELLDGPVHNYILETLKLFVRYDLLSPNGYKVLAAMKDTWNDEQ